MSREYPQMKLRLPPDLKDFLAEEAKRRGRTLNAEIVFRLEQTAAISRAGQALSEGTKEDATRQTLLLGVRAARDLVETLEGGLKALAEEDRKDAKRSK